MNASPTVCNTIFSDVPVLSPTPVPSSSFYSDVAAASRDRVSLILAGIRNRQAASRAKALASVRSVTATGYPSVRQVRSTLTAKDVSLVPASDLQTAANSPGLCSTPECSPGANPFLHPFLNDLTPPPATSVRTEEHVSLSTSPR